MKMAEPHTFRATMDAWLGQLLLPLCFFIMLTITAINFAGLSPAAGSVGLAVLTLVIAFEYLFPMIRNWLYLDANAIEGSLNGRYFQVYWTEVKATWLYEKQRRRFLCLGTREGTLVIPLRFFDETAVWEQVQDSVPPAALEQDALQRLPDYQDWVAARETILDNPTPRQVADHWLIQIIGWSGVAFFIYGVIHAFRENNLALALVQLCLVGLNLALLVNWGITEISSECVYRFTMIGRWSISWDEVRAIEIDLFDSVIVLVGNDRRLAVPGPGVWNGYGRKEAMALLLAQAERRQIPLRRSMLALFKGSRNTRISKKSEDKG